MTDDRLYVNNKQAFNLKSKYAVSESNASWLIFSYVYTKTSWLVKNVINNGNLWSDVIFNLGYNEITHDALESETANCDN